jgi:hypothetical protein
VSLLDDMRMIMRRRHYSRRTEEAYTGWVVRYARYHPLRTAQDVRAFLGHLAAEDTNAICRETARWAQRKRTGVMKER